MTNSRYLKWFYQIEKELWKFFDRFGDLCSRCALQTLEESAGGRRANRDRWCCCMIDNQVHDNWEALNANQNRSDRNWYAKLKPLDMGRMPGNGPCPALGPTGCQLNKHRPITCTTQLCSRMLEVLNSLKLVKCPVHRALQIEDIIELPDILPGLYGSGRKPCKISADEVEVYIRTVRQLRKKMAALPQKQREQAINRAAVSS
jgi:Fe-S-cluster containining protein